MRNSNLKTLASVLATIPCLYAGNAFADYASFNVLSLSTQQILVQTDGSKYTKSNLGTDFEVMFRAILDAETSGKIKKWKAWPSIGKSGWPKNKWKQYKEHSDGESYSYFNRPKKINKVRTVKLPFAKVEDFLIGYCNGIANDLRAQGKSNAEIFSETRSSKLWIKIDYTYDMSGIAAASGDITQGGGPLPHEEVEVKCLRKKIDFKPADNLVSNPSTITDIAVSLKEDAAVDGSRCRVNMSAAFHSSKAHTAIKYRYVYLPAGSGAEYKYSAIKTIVTDHAKVAMVDDWHNVPVINGREKGHIWIEAHSPNDYNSPMKYFDMDCTKELSIMTEHPIQRSVKFVPGTTRQIGNQVCPVNGHIVATLKATGTAYSGFGRLTVKDEKGQQFGSPNYPVELSTNNSTFFGMPFDPEWETGINNLEANVGNPSIKKQVLKYRLSLAKSETGGSQVPPEKDLVISCVATVQGVTARQNMTAFSAGASAKQTVNTASTSVVVAKNLPDLMIKQVVQKGKKKMKVQIANVGKVPSKPVTLRMSGGPGNKAVKKTKSLAPGKSQWITLKLKKEAPKAVFTVDSQNQVRESNEKNNKKEKRFN
ncbi:MAG: hypothetical protein MI743_10410 [Sneathiellales bacterium]|nr:hypothetical protein [Sneathiellales bacterium]